MPITPDQQAEIDALRSNAKPTLRAVAEGMEGHLYKAYDVLDHGFIRVIDYMGDDAAICQAARVSYGKGTKSVQNDEGLIRYLMRHWHSTPFEMCEIKLHVKLPVFVARQWIRHRTANVNEYSARYSILDREFYIPEPDKLAAQSVINNQGRGEALSGDEAARVLEYLKGDAARCYDHYAEMISDDGQQGLARELARMNLPANIYTQWYWKVDLHNLFSSTSCACAPTATPNTKSASTPKKSAKSSPIGCPPPTAPSRTTAWAAPHSRQRRLTACGVCLRVKRSRKRPLVCPRGNGGSLKGLLGR